MRKIWNFAMAAIVIVASAGLLAACNKDDVGTDNPWSNGEYEFVETDLTAMEILSSAEGWSGVDVCYYTEPDRKGDKYYNGDPGMNDGGVRPLYAFSPDVLTMYISNLSIPVAYYVDVPLAKIDDSLYQYDDGETYIKILGYDEENVLIETNSLKVTCNDVEYRYSTILLKKHKPSSTDWKKGYLSYDEYLEFMENRK